MARQDRSIFSSSTVESHSNSVYASAEDQHGTEPPSRNALGSESAHNDPSLAAWKASAHTPNLGEHPSRDGTGYAIGGE
jgi:hypothetical protein